MAQSTVTMNGDMNGTDTIKLMNVKYTDLPTEDSDGEGSVEEWIADLNRVNTLYTKSPLIPGEEKSRRTCVVFSVILLVLVAILVGLLVWKTYKDEIKVCTTPECVSASAYIYSRMDTTADPCQDFYQYACGGWDNTTIPPPQFAKYSGFQEIEASTNARFRQLLTQDTGSRFEKSTTIQNAKKYYKLCMDTEKIENSSMDALYEFIKDMGFWTLSTNPHGNWSKDTWDMMEVMKYMVGESFTAFYGVYLSRDDKDGSIHRIKFVESGLTLGSKELYNTSHSQTPKLKKAFIKYVTDYANILGAVSDTQTQAEELYQFEKDLSEIFSDPSSPLTPEQKYNKRTMAQLQDMIGRNSMFQVKPIMDILLNRDVPATEEVIVPHLDYYRNINSVLEKYRDKTHVLANFMVWRCIELFSHIYLPDKFTQPILKFYHAMNGITAFSPRWDSCVDSTNAKYDFATSVLFADKYYDAGVGDSVGSMFNYIKEAFISRLPKIGWMTRHVKEKAKEKAQSITSKVGYYEKFDDIKYMDEYYSKQEVLDTLLATLLLHRRVSMRRTMDRYDKKPDAKRWGDSPLAVNAYYSRRNNNIVIPLGITYRPFFDMTFPGAYRFGSFGFIIGHEFTHGFDDSGRKFDKHGNLAGWWDNSSANAFQERSKCFREQYDKYELEGEHINGRLTLSENIADNGGVTLAMNAYTAWTQDHPLSPNLPNLPTNTAQLMYIGFAHVWCAIYKPEYAKSSLSTDEHTYSPFRVKGAVTNTKHFANAFKCPSGSPMNPPNKCSIW